MSNIPQARAILTKLLDADMSMFVRRGINQAMDLLWREQPEFRADVYLPPMSRKQVQRARELRERGWPLQRIADTIGTNQGRISEAINGKREGI